MLYSLVSKGRLKIDVAAEEANVSLGEFENRWRKQDIKFLNWYSLIVTRYVKYRPGLHKYVQTGFYNKNAMYDTKSLQLTYILIITIWNTKRRTTYG